MIGKVLFCDPSTTLLTIGKKKKT